MSTPAPRAESAYDREVAGARRRFLEAAHAAECALARDARDAASWHLLAASRFMLNQRDEALEAWNAIEGLTGTRSTLVAEAIGTARHDLLTARSVRHARRRLELVPSVAASRVDYRLYWSKEFRAPLSDESSTFQQQGAPLGARKRLPAVDTTRVRA